ncbi:hypothetical protein AAG565_03040 [Fontimonas sp. SYSU GA230001]|uniref:hypothetical protein n=1 Tax=Fontimonas sp. SYSU GA230001 TaxID=3142450 RepID=UPI0032B4E1A4
MRHLLVVVAAACALAACADRDRNRDRDGAGITPTTRYAFANQCWALRVGPGGRYVARSGDTYAATAARPDDAEAFFLKPSALGTYLLYGHDARLLAAAAPVTSLALADAEPAAEWTVVGRGDATVYPAAPAVDVDPDAAAVAAYRAFVDPGHLDAVFTLRAQGDQSYLALDAGERLTTDAQAAAAADVSFAPLPLQRCAAFPEAQDDVRGSTFSGTRGDGRVLGFADSHLHATSTSFLGGAKPGWTFHKYGVTHALADCAAQHGPNGMRDLIGSLFTGDFDGHDTRGWPYFPDWPSRTATTHEAVYWKWMERAWKAGLRLVLNYAVDNETLCEIQRNAAGTPLRNCNEMVNAGRQIATAYALQDYIDAQYGGRGAGWYRIVTTPAQARSVIGQGKVAVLLGIEVSNLLDCSVTFNPLSTQEAFEETGDPAGGGQLYGCAMTETGAGNEILTQLQRLKDLGVSGLFTVHEFDNAFGGSDIFDGLVLNLGTRENSGGLGSADRLAAMAQFDVPAQLEAISHLEASGAATGEFWSTYDCPAAESDEAGGGFVFPVGAVMTNLGPPPPLCPYLGQGGRPGGATACYPAAPQCNARLLTPIGLYTYGKIMELGFIFEIDHLAFALKDQLLDLAAAQTPNYPLVSGHAWSGLSWRQARRIFAGGGIVYPSLNSTADYTSLWRTIKPLWHEAGAPYEFGFGFGSDTNGMSPQMAPRATIADGKALRYPFTLFDGPVFDALPEFRSVAGVVFDQPGAFDADGNGRHWHEDIDGNAHYGMAADFVEELRLEGTPEQMRDLYNSAEVYLQFWERTQAASAAVRAKGLVVPDGLLRAAPVTP